MHSDPTGNAAMRKIRKRKKVTPKRNPAPVIKIHGFKFTKHALDRALERGVYAVDVDAALQYGNYRPQDKPNLFKVMGNKAIVVVDSLAREVITVYPAV